MTNWSRAGLKGQPGFSALAEPMKACNPGNTVPDRRNADRSR